MSEQRKIRKYLYQLSETREIMEAMKNLALVELHKLGRHLEYQQQMVKDLENMAYDFLDFYPYTFSDGGDQPNVVIIFGSERGFCGDFNEALITNLDDRVKALGGSRQLLIPVGTKLCLRLDDDSRVTQQLEGADVTEEVTHVLNNLLSHISNLHKQYGACNVYTLFHHSETGQLTTSQLLPPFKRSNGPLKKFTTPPVLNIPPQELIAALVDQYLFTALHETACMSLMEENYSRIRHMTAALQRLDEQSNKLTRKYHIFRQEEITEEIEVILLNAAELT